jgi:hypothetical protein
MLVGSVYLNRAPLSLVGFCVVDWPDLPVVVVDWSTLGVVDVTDWLAIVCENIWNAASPTASVPFLYAGTSCPEP